MNNLKLYEKMNDEIIKALMQETAARKISMASTRDEDGDEWMVYTIDGYAARVLPARLLYVRIPSDNYRVLDFLAKMTKTVDETTRVPYVVDILGNIPFSENAERKFVIDSKILNFYGKPTELSLYKDFENKTICHIHKGGVYVGFVCVKAVPK